MTVKYVRGQLLVFHAAPTDHDGAAVAPELMRLYLNYVHSDDLTVTDDPIVMDQQTDGTYRAEFDTKVAKPGAAFASIRATNPAGAEDIKFTITANRANPDVEPTV